MAGSQGEVFNPLTKDILKDFLFQIYGQNARRNFNKRSPAICS